MFVVSTFCNKEGILIWPDCESNQNYYNKISYRRGLNYWHQDYSISGVTEHQTLVRYFQNDARPNNMLVINYVRLSIFH